MNGKRVAVIVSHPAHLLTIAGMLLRWQPDALILFRSVAGGGVGQEAAIRPALASLGLADRTTSFAVSETESFDHALAGDFAYPAVLSERVFAWLRTVQPDVVLGDAYETYNFHHDAARLMIDGAVRRLRRL